MLYLDTIILNHKLCSMFGILNKLILQKELQKYYDTKMCSGQKMKHNINWRDVQRKNIANNVAMSSLRAPWQNGSYTNKHT